MSLSDSNSRKIGVILSYILLAVQAIIGLLYVPLLLNILGKNEYGLYQLMGSLVAYFSVMDFGLSASIVRYYSKYQATKDKENMENVLGLSQRLYFVISIILFILAFIFYFLIDPMFKNSLTVYEIMESKKIYMCLIFNVLITLLTNIHTVVITANEKFIFLKSISIIQQLIQPFVVVLVITKSPKALNVVLVQTCLNLILGLSKVMYMKYKLKIKAVFHSLDKTLIRGMIRLSLSVFIVTLVDQIFWKSNQFILGVISGTSAVALYSVAAQIYMNYMPFSSTIQGIFLPHITKRISLGADDHEISNLFIKIGRIQYLILGLVLFGFIVYGKSFITLWTGKDYIDAYYIALLIMIPFTIDLIENTGLAIMQAKNIYGYRAKLYGSIAILNILLSITFGKVYGALGCAIATSIAMFLGNGIAMNIFYIKKLKIDILSFFKNIGRISIAPLITSIICVMVKMFLNTNSWLYLFINIMIFVFFYIILTYMISLNKYEKNLIRGIFIKLSPK